MRQLLVLAAVAGLALARPESYREKEDFQFSRSSTDEGHRSGYYGAQRGNMGGNYEKAHNMDPLAQNQMSGLVRQVEGELGDGANQKAGSVFTAANSRGTYGSGHYDLSNLEGRNFQESGSLGDSQSHSSLTSHHGSRYNGQYSGANSAGYASSQTHNSRYGGYNSAGNSEQSVYSGSHQASGNLKSASLNDRNAAHNYDAQYSQTGYNGQAYDQGSSLSLSSNGYGSNQIRTRLVSGSPVRIIIRPGTTVTAPVAAQTYDASQNTASFDGHASSFDQNAINSEAEVLNNNDQQIVLTPSRPKHYDSSYSYRKEWEKHDTKPVSAGVPLAIPTTNPANSELYDDAQVQSLEQQQQKLSEISSQSQHSSHSGYNTHSASSSQSRQQAYNANAGSSAYTHGSHNAGAAYNRDASGAYNGAYTGDTAGVYNADSDASINQVDSNTKPKNYQSAYSYHKLWERQGDPYEIEPTHGALLSAGAVKNGAYNTHQYGSRQHQSHQSYSNSDDCDENGHIRVARSYNSHHHQEPMQQSQENYQDQENLGQQTQQILQEFGQQSQSKWDNIEELGQQTQQLQSQNLEDFGQQSQSKWDNIEDLGQHTQQLQSQNLEDFDQQSQSKWDKIVSPQSQTDLGQQTQDTWSTLDTMLSENNDRITEQKPSTPTNSAEEQHGMNIGFPHQENIFENSPLNNQHIQTESHTFETDSNKNSTHHAHTIWDEIKKEEIGQENEDSIESELAQTANLGQQTQVTWGSINQHEDSLSNPWNQQSSDKDQLSFHVNTEQNNQNDFGDMPNSHPWMYNQVYHHNSANSNQYHSQSSYSVSQAHWPGHSTNMNSNSYDSNAEAHSSGSAFGSSVLSLWDKLDQIEKETIPSRGIDRDATSKHDGQLDGTATAFDSQVHRKNEFDSHNTDKTVSTSSTTTKPNEALNKDEKVRPHDIGRGDIGTDDVPNETTETFMITESRPNSTPYKTPEEIETLSLTKETDKTETHNETQIKKDKEDESFLSVMSLDQQYQSDHHDKLVNTSTSGISKTTTTTTTTEKSNYHYTLHNVNDHSKEEKESRDNEQQFENQGQQNFDQQSLFHQFGDMAQGNLDQQNTDQQFFDFGKQSENLGSDLPEEQFETQNLGQTDSFHQHHQTMDLGQQNKQFDQASLSGWQHGNIDQQKHQLAFWTQQNENLGQQSQSEWKDMDGQVHIHWNQPIPSEDLQQHSELTDTFAHNGDMMEDQQSQLNNLFLHGEKLEGQEKEAVGHGDKMEDQKSQQTYSYDNMQKIVNEQNDKLAHIEKMEEPQSQLTDASAHGEGMEDLNQQEDLQQQSQLTETLSVSDDHNKEIDSTYHKMPEVSEGLIVPKKVVAVETPPEVVTEKPGFWQSVGGKLSSAKDKVKSWFSS